MHLVRTVLTRLSSYTVIRRNFSDVYKSALSLDKLYPNSLNNIALSSNIAHEKVQKNNSGDGKFSGYIPIESLQIKYSRSSGPGGQHVNKVNTKVDVRFHMMSATWIPDALKDEIIKNYKNTLTKDGYLIIRSDKTRTQMLNLADCMDKLRTLIRQVEGSIAAREVLDEEQLAINQDRADLAAARRLSDKRRHSLKKQQRQIASLE